MKNTIGTSVSLTVFGESHGPEVGVVLDGLAPGVKVSEESIARQLARRRPSQKTDTARVEEDKFRILSGVRDGRSCGSPICISIPNTNVHSADYIADIARPSHADYAADTKYHGFQDQRGGGHFSGRVTAGIVAAGAICLDALRSRGIRTASHILACGSVKDRGWKEFKDDFNSLEGKIFPTLDDEAGAAMLDEILDARSKGDSVGGIIQAAVTGLPAGVGEPWFDSLEAVISRAMFAIGGVKGIEFGAGFSLGGMKGSEANDAFRIRDGKVVTLSNNSGGINGGISNGMPIVFNLAVRPTPSIAQRQESVNFREMKDVSLEIKGRHDPAIIRRICPVVDCMTAVVLCDCLAIRFGTDWITGGSE